jgi:hypothetical protein
MSLEAAEIAARSLALAVVPVVAEGEDTPPFWMVLEVPLGRVRATTTPASAAAVDQHFLDYVLGERAVGGQHASEPQHRGQPGGRELLESHRVPIVGVSDMNTRVVRRSVVRDPGMITESGKLSLGDSSHLTAGLASGRLEPGRLNFTHTTRTAHGTCGRY